ncbi:hypothetical protein amb2391 [Paramagnetospirillum magneticum AMB-1]|uniref:Uncharacterized protein n=1 Tax=Paramagnetospirillum magneticum (strain ATCC 700264 / AMB-1) TaxID=342108 RepID=Q2W4N0_PARM1|nr:hypothetical protein amb2391 [Paramagnetospirillum magneticum AMB-1]
MAGDWLKRIGVMAAVLLLSSCYIPDKFRSELRLSKYGDYSLTYKGDLMFAPILDDYRKNKIKPEDEAERQENIRRDLARDIAFRKIESKGKGRFAVEYERVGRLEKVQLTSLIRRDARMLSLRSMENGAIVVKANAMKPSDAQILAELGLNMEGEFRITTDGNVVKHNATQVKPFGAAKVYIWKIENALSAMPELVMIRDVDPERPLAPRASELK